MACSSLGILLENIISYFSVYNLWMLYGRVDVEGDASAFARVFYCSCARKEKQKTSTNAAATNLF
jgi:hypothetical protein